MPTEPPVPTDRDHEEALGRVAVWLDPEDARWLVGRCTCAPDAPADERKRCDRVRFRVGAALHKAGLPNNPWE
jgi:hypothetical protein